MAKMEQQVIMGLQGDKIIQEVASATITNDSVVQESGRGHYILRVHGAT